MHRLEQKMKELLSSINPMNAKRVREEILKVHTRKKPLEASVDLAQIARSTVGFTGADLANLLNEAALLAARRGKDLIGMDEIEDALNKIIMGPRKKTNVMNDKEKKNTAYHEAGHAVVGYLVGCDPVHMITIVPTGRGALGYTSFRPEADRYQMYKQDYKNEIAMGLGGRAAEEIIFGDVTSGAYSDIQSATETAKRMVTLFGMSEKLGPRRFGSDQNEVFLGRDFSSNADYSDAIAAVIVGGSSMSGGKAAVTGTVAGILILTVISNALVAWGISPRLQECVKGAVIIIAVLSQYRKER